MFMLLLIGLEVVWLVGWLVGHWLANTDVVRGKPWTGIQPWVRGLSRATSSRPPGPAIQDHEPDICMCNMWRRMQNFIFLSGYKILSNPDWKKTLWNWSFIRFLWTTTPDLLASFCSGHLEPQTGYMYGNMQILYYYPDIKVFQIQACIKKT